MVLTSDAAGLPLDGHDAAGTLAVAASLVRARRQVEADELRVVGHWADLHGTDPAEDREPGQAATPGGDRLRRFGGEGTPPVRELSTYELAVARGESVQATRSLLADTLDLRHRLPLVWAAVQRCELPAWVARKVASLARVLPHDRCEVVDRAVARAVSHAPGKVLALAEAKVVEADPDGHAARLEAERLRRYVSLGRTDAAGMRTLVARVGAGDGAAVEATVSRVADILGERARAEQAAAGAVEAAPGAAAAGTPLLLPTRDQLRAQALTWLARPAELLALLLEHADDAPAPDLPPEPHPDADHEPDREQGGKRSSVRAPEPGPGSGLLAFPAALLHALRSRDLRALRPRAVLYVHLHEHSLDRLAAGGGGVARAEGIGPVNLEHLAELLGDRQLSVQPVLDLADRVSTAAYEFPTGLRQRLHLVFDGDAFPHAGTRPDQQSRRLDHDHVVPWQPPDPHETGPPAHQTSMLNGQPLTRGAHRAKTHLGYTCEPLDIGIVRWHTPHGLTRVVDHRGTHHESRLECALRDIVAAHAA